MLLPFWDNPENMCRLVPFSFKLFLSLKKVLFAIDSNMQPLNDAFIFFLFLNIELFSSVCNSLLLFNKILMIDFFIIFLLLPIKLSFDLKLFLLFFKLTFLYKVFPNSLLL